MEIREGYKNIGDENNIKMIRMKKVGKIRKGKLKD